MTDCRINDTDASYVYSSMNLCPETTYSHPLSYSKLLTVLKMANTTVLNKKALEIWRIGTALVTIRYKNIDFFLDFNVTVEF